MPSTDGRSFRRSRPASRSAQKRAVQRLRLHENLRARAAIARGQEGLTQATTRIPRAYADF
eukprot:4007234-Pleurochrysis_carterae.AAC.1